MKKSLNLFLVTLLSLPLTSASLMAGADEDLHSQIDRCDLADDERCLANILHKFADRLSRRVQQPDRNNAGWCECFAWDDQGCTGTAGLFFKELDDGVVRSTELRRASWKRGVESECTMFWRDRGAFETKAVAESECQRLLKDHPKCR